MKLLIPSQFILHLQNDKVCDRDDQNVDQT